MSAGREMHSFLAIAAGMMGTLVAGQFVRSRLDDWIATTGEFGEIVPDRWRDGAVRAAVAAGAWWASGYVEGGVGEGLRVAALGSGISAGLAVSGMVQHGGMGLESQWDAMRAEWSRRNSGEPQ